MEFSNRTGLVSLVLAAWALQGCEKQFFSFTRTNGQSQLDGGSSAPACEGGGSESQTLPLVVSTLATQQTNVVFVLDTSGSMANEIDQVRANMAKFVTDVKGSLDPATTSFAIIGTAQSGDAVLPNTYSPDQTFNDVYWHYQEVGSKDKLLVLMRSFGMTTFQVGGVTRTLGSTRMKQIPTFDLQGACSTTGTLFNCDTHNHIVIVTDDIETLPNVSGQDATRTAFMNSFADFLSANRNTYRVHGIHAKQTSTCSIAQYGKIYEDMAAATNALSIDVCTTDWAPVFDALKENIITSARKSLRFGQCASSARTVTSVKIKWGTSSEVTLTASEYVLTTGANTLPTIYIPPTTLTAHAIPTDGTPLSLVVESSW